MLEGITYHWAMEGHFIRGCLWIGHLSLSLQEVGVTWDSCMGRCYLQMVFWKEWTLKMPRPLRDVTSVLLIWGWCDVMLLWAMQGRNFPSLVRGNWCQMNTEGQPTFQFLPTPDPRENLWLLLPQPFCLSALFLWQECQSFCRQFSCHSASMGKIYVFIYWPWGKMGT